MLAKASAGEAIGKIDDDEDDDDDDDDDKNAGLSEEGTQHCALLYFYFAQSIQKLCFQLDQEFHCRILVCLAIKLIK